MDWDEVERQEIAHIEKARQELRQYREQQKQQQQELEAHRQRLAQSVAGKYVVRRWLLPGEKPVPGVAYDLQDLKREGYATGQSDTQQ